MKKVLVACALLGSSTAFAADAFTGFSVELGAASRGFEGNISNYRINGAAIPTSQLSFDKVDKTKTQGEIGLKYTWELSPNFLMGVSYERALQDAKLGSPTIVFQGVREVLNETQVKVEDMQSLVIQPGFKLTNSTLLSLRLGMTSSTVKFVTIGEPTDEIKARNLLTGIGITQMISENFYVGGTFDLLKGKDKSVSGIDSEGDRYSYNFESKGQAFRAFVGYRF